MDMEMGREAATCSEALCKNITELTRVSNLGAWWLVQCSLKQRLRDNPSHFIRSSSLQSLCPSTVSHYHPAI